MGKNYNSSRLVNGLSVDASGNVGVGGSPSGSYKFEVTGTTKTSDTIRILTGANTTDISYAVGKEMSTNNAAFFGWRYNSGGTPYGFISVFGTSGRFSLMPDGGNVGIGTSSPETLLHIKGTPETATVLRFSPTSSTTIFSQVVGNNGDLILSADPNNAEGSTSMKFNVDGSERMRITSTGNVGIGTTNPLSKLSVGGDGYASRAITAIASGTDFGMTLQQNSTGGGLQIYANVSSWGNIPMQIQNNTGYQFIVTTAGNIGIGTGSPDSLLHIFDSASGSNKTYVKFSCGDGGHIRVGKNDGVSNDAVFGTWSNNQTIFYSNSTERMRIKSSGEVGVGTIPVNIASGWASLQSGNLTLMGPSPGSDKNGIIGANAYYNGGWKRIIASYANYVELNQGAGNIQFYTGGTGAADGIIGATPGPYLLNGGVSWTNGSSDVRKKKNFEPSQGLAELLQIEPVKYHFNWDDDNAKKRLGFKAQNLQNIIPEMVIETDELAEDGTNYLTITPDYLLPVLVKAIQELNTKLQDQQQTINSLINR